MHFKLSRAWFAAACVTVSLALSAEARTVESRAASAASAVEGIAKIQIDNFGRINPNYSRGAQPKGRDYADLAALGVKTLIDLTSDDSTVDEKVLAARVGMR